jgi:hypothetical protein
MAFAGHKLQANLDSTLGDTYMGTQLALGTQIAIGLVLIASSVSKLVHPIRFINGVVEYQILPRKVAVAFGALVVPCEFFLALSHLTSIGLLKAIPITIFLLICFAVAIGVTVRRSRILPCLCFGGDELVSAHSLARLILLILSEIFLLILLTAYSLQPVDLTPSRNLVELIGISVFLLIISMWVLRSRDVFNLVRDSLKRKSA